MLPLSPIRLFVCKFILFYFILAMPWPGLHTAYGHYFRALGRRFFEDTDTRELSFETVGGTERHSNNTRIVIVNRSLMHQDGSGPVRNLDLDEWGFWLESALLLALIGATPISWKRRAWAIFYGLMMIYVFLICFLGLCIWNESAEIGLVTLTPFWKSFFNGVKEMGISQLSLAIPVLIWILVTFRRGDLFWKPVAKRAMQKPSSTLNRLQSSR